MSSTSTRHSVPHLFESDKDKQNRISSTDLHGYSPNTINGRLLKYKEIQILYNKTYIPPIYFLVLLGVLVVFIFVGYFEDHLILLIGTMYPIYISIKSIQIGDSDEIKKWLAYWLVFTFFMYFETFFWYLLQYIPLYFFLKIIFLILMFLPKYEGAVWFYDSTISILFNKYEHKIMVFTQYLGKETI